MKKVFVAGLILLAVFLMSGLAASDANAQAPAKPLTIYIGAGVSVPTGDLGDGWKLGFHGMGRGGFSVAPKLDVLIGGDYHTFSIDDMGATNITGGTYSAITLGGDLKLSLASPTMTSEPYLLGGLGFAIQSISDLSDGTTTVSFDSQTDLFAEFGAGIGFKQFFAQGKYVMIFADGETISFLPVSVGVKF